MNHASESPFDSIESAHDFVSLLSEAVAQTKQDIEADIQRESGGKSPRRLEALRVASYNLEKLEIQMTKSGRILNDLRSLRRLLFEERKPASVLPVQSKQVQMAQAEPQVKPFPANLPAQASDPGSGRGSAVAA
jgi:hypothetical protein